MVFVINWWCFVVGLVSCGCCWCCWLCLCCGFVVYVFFGVGVVDLSSVVVVRTWYVLVRVVVVSRVVFCP